MKKNLAALMAGVCLAGALQATQDSSSLTFNVVAQAASTDSSFLTVEAVAPAASRASSVSAWDMVDQKDTKVGEVVSVWEVLTRGVSVQDYGTKRVDRQPGRDYVDIWVNGSADYRARDSRFLDFVQRLAGMPVSALNSGEGQSVKAEVESLRGLLSGDDGMAADCLASMLNALKYKLETEAGPVRVDDGAVRPQRAVLVEISSAAAAQPQIELVQDVDALMAQLEAQKDEIEQLKAEIAEPAQDASLPEATQVND